jgi:hypothetical protein
MVRLAFAALSLAGAGYAYPTLQPRQTDPEMCTYGRTDVDSMKRSGADVYLSNFLVTGDAWSEYIP